MDIIQNHTHFACSLEKMSEEEEAVPEQEAEAEGEEEMEEAEVLSPGSSGGVSSTAPDEAEESLDIKLARILELPQTTLQAMAESEDGRLLLEKVAEHLDGKEEEIKEYEGALKELTLSMTQEQVDGSESVVCII